MSSIARPLKARQRIFVAEYLIDLNGKEAAIRAGYARGEAHVTAWKLLRRPPVKAALGAAMAARAQRLGIGKARVIAEYARIAYSDWRAFADWNAEGVAVALDSSGLFPGDSAAIAELGELRRRGKRSARVRLHDKIGALDSLGRILGLFGGPALDPASLEESPLVPELPPQPTPPAEGLTERQARFAREYLADLNATQAAIRAGYAARSASDHVPRLLRHPAIAAAIEALLQSRLRPTLATADRVLLEYARVAFADIARLARWGPDGVTLRPRESIDPDDTAAIETIETGGGKVVTLRLYDKLYALDALARHLGLIDRRTPGRSRRQSWNRVKARAASRGRVAI